MNFWRKTLVVLSLMIFLTTISEAKTNKNFEIIYFKANLACCKARACDAVQADVENFIKQNYSKENIQFKLIKLSDTANKELIEKYKAKSQTVILRVIDNKNAEFVDLSDVVTKLSRYHAKDIFDKEMKQSIDTFLAGLK